MTKHTMRRFSAAVMSMILLVMMLVAALPTVSAEAAPTSDILPSAASVAEGNGAANATANALTVTTEDANAVTVSLTDTAFYLDADGFHALSLSVKTTQMTALTLILSNGTVTKELSTADHFGNVTYIEDGKLPAGDCGTIVLDIAALTEWDDCMVTLTAITVTTDAAGTVVFYGMAATTKEAAPIGTSLLPTEDQWDRIAVTDSSTGAVQSEVIVEKQDALNGWKFGSTNGMWPSVIWDISSNPVETSLFSEISYNLNVESTTTVLLFFEHINAGTDTFQPLDLDYGRHVYLKLNSLINPNLESTNASLPKGHYEGTISMADIMQLCSTYHGTNCPDDTTNDACGLISTYDLILKGMVHIGAVKIFAADEEVTVYDLSVIEPDVVDGPVGLMPTAEAVSGIEGLSYDSDGWLTYTADAAGTVTVPVGKYYNINEFPNFFAEVKTDISSGFSNNAWDIAVTTKGIVTAASGAYKEELIDSFQSRTVGLWGNWGQNTDPLNALMINPTLDASVLQAFIGGPNWAKIIPDNGVMYIENVRLTVCAAGTIKVRSMSMTDSESGTVSLPSVSLSLGAVEGAPGEVVEVPLVLDSTTGIANFDAAITFDNTYLTVGDIVWKADLLNNALDADTTNDANGYFTDRVNGDTIKLAFMSYNNNSAAGGVIATIPVTIAENAPAKMYPLTMTVGDLQVYSDSQEYYPDEYGVVTVGADKRTITDGSIAVGRLQDPVTVTVGTGEVYAAQTVTIPVSVSDDHFVQSGTVSITYDPNVLTIEENTIDVTNTLLAGATVTKTVDAVNGTITMTFANATPVKDGGVLFNMTFTAASPLTAGSTSLNATVADLTAAQGGVAYQPPVEAIGGVVTLKDIDPATRKVTFTATPTASTVGKNDIIKVDIVLEATAPVATFSGLALTFDNAQMTPVKQNSGYVVWNAAVANGTSTYENNGMVTLSGGAVGNTADTAITIGSVYFVPNINNIDIAVALSGASVMLSMPDEYDAENGTVAAMIIDYVGGSFVVGTTAATSTTTTTTTTAATTLPSVGDKEVQFLVTSSSDIVSTTQTFTVDIVLNSPVGVSDVGLDITYDSALLTPVAQADGTWIAWNAAVIGSGSNIYTASSVNDGAVHIAYVAPQMHTAASGVLGTLTFRVNEDALATNVEKTTTAIGIDTDAASISWYDASAEDDYYTAYPETLNVEPLDVTVIHANVVKYYDVLGETLLDTKYFPSGVEMTYDTPAGINTDKLNYAFLGWKVFESTTTSYAEVHVKPIYGYTVEVIGGSITGEFVTAGGGWMNDAKTKAYFNFVRTGLYGYDNYAQVVAPATDANNNAFSHWSDQYGNIVSYKATYRFYVPANVLLIANYATTAEASAATPKAALQTLRSVTGDDGKTTMTWVCAVATVDGYTIEDYGIVLSPQADYSMLTAPDGKTAVTLTASEGRSKYSWQYSVTVKNVAANKARYAVAYVTYSDGTTDYTVYSPIYMGMTTPAQ